MKVCITAHNVPSFGEIPVGSVWADDSPYVIEADCFAEGDTVPAPKKPKNAKEPVE